MCTSLCVYQATAGDRQLWFGRNMDIEAHFGEAVIVTPREYAFSFRYMGKETQHYAMVGTAAVRDGFPLYADAMNEKGLCMAGLHFPGNAVYLPPTRADDGIYRLAPFELIPYLLGTCGTVEEVKAVLRRVAVVDVPFSPALPNTPLHWHIAASDGAVIVEAVAEGLRIYEDTVGVLTNNPPYPFHLTNLYRYTGMTAEALPDGRSQRQETHPGETYDLGMGLVGLPGDYTSPARFVRCATLKRLTAWDGLPEDEAAVQFFKILSSCCVPRGCVLTKKGEYHATRYSACMDTARLTYHVFGDEKITPLSVALTDERCDGKNMTWFTR